MIQRTSLRALSSAVLLALLVTAVHPLPAYAEEGTPPPPEPVPAEATAQESAPVPDALPEQAIPDDVLGESTPEASDAPAPEADVVAPGAEEAVVEAADLLAAIPDGTTLAVVDAQGEDVPLVSVEAQAIVASGDPIWCPASVKAPTPGLGGCTASFATFTELLAVLPTVTPADGIIWIADTYNSSLDGSGVLINGSLLGGLAPFRLTLRGGWADPSDGLGDGKIHPETPSIFNGTRLSITDWENDVTLSDLEFTGTSGGSALQVITTGNIALTRIAVHGTSGPGAYLDTTSGPAGKISVSSSQFNQNSAGSGLDARANSTITLASVIANENGYYGAYLDNTSGSGGITLTGASTFNDNSYTGLYAHSTGAIAANDLTAERNGLTSSGNGVDLSNSYGSPAAASPGIKLTGMNIFAGNYIGGLSVSSYGAIALNSLHANANLHSSGVVVNNTGAAFAAPVTFTGTNEMHYNASDGLDAYSKGKITTNSLTANGNGGYGAYLGNDNNLDYNSDVVLTGANTFHDNGDTGLYVTSFGAIAAANLAADRNGNNGAILSNNISDLAKNVTLTGVNLFHDNQATNLYIRTRGAVTASSVTASGSVAGSGMDVLNTNLVTPTIVQKVTLTGTNVFDNNYNHGLAVQSYGAISVSSLRASGNGLAFGYGFGASLDNASGPSEQPITLSGSSLASGNYSGGLYITSWGNIIAANLTASGNTHGAGAAVSNSGGSGTVTLTGTNVFNDNYNLGLSISSANVIKANSLTASGNGTGGSGSGASFGNTTAGTAAPKDVILTGTNVFHDNHNDGLTVGSYGAITLSSVSASANGATGLMVYNSGGTIPKPITLSGSYSLTDNHDYGLFAQSLGAVKINNLTASGNDYQGAYIYNADGLAVGGVTLTGATVLRENSGYGMTLDSRGAVSMAGVTAIGNSNLGVTIANTYAGADVGNASVTLTGTNVLTDNGSGLSIASLRAISVSNLTASQNTSGAGARLFNHYSYASGGVTLSGVNAFNDNAETGLAVISLGPITLSSVTASGNGTSSSDYGANLNNNGASTAQAVKLTGTNSFNDNAGDGLYVYSWGAVSISSLTASRNTHGYGARIDNGNGSAVGGVTLSGTNLFEDNGYIGLHLETHGAITLNSVTASGNGLDGSYSGALLDNHISGTQPVKLTGTNAFHNNTAAGLDLLSRGAITINNLSASGNDGGRGASLANNMPGVSGAVTLSGTNVFNDNAMDGLRVMSYGTITLNSVTASGNADSGATLENTGSPAATPPGVKLTGTNSFDENGAGGIIVTSDGAITANNLSAQGNLGGDGATLDNDSGAGTVTLTGVNTFTNNVAWGLRITTNAAVSLTKVTADNNSHGGVSITGPATDVTVTCGSFTSNGTYGLYVNASGLLKLIGVIASGNPTGDLVPDAGSWDVTRACPLS